jgi:hypothetical protein
VGLGLNAACTCIENRFTPALSSPRKAGLSYRRVYHGAPMKTSVNEYSVSIATTSTVLLSPNPKRIALLISAPLTNRFTLSLRGSAAVLDAGVTLFPSIAGAGGSAGQFLFLTRTLIGDSIEQPVSAISFNAAQNVNVVEWVGID